MTKTRLSTARLPVCARPFAALMMLAMVLTALVPAGFMPSFERAGKVALVICSGMGEKTIIVDAADYAPGSDDAADTTSACPYYLAQGAASLDHPVMVSAPAPLLAPLPSLPDTAPLHAGLIMPSPPARGPPAVTLS